jgi:hypothetical protein
LLVRIQLNLRSLTYPSHDWQFQLIAEFAATMSFIQSGSASRNLRSLLETTRGTYLLSMAASRSIGVGGTGDLLVAQKLGLCTSCGIPFEAHYANNRSRL